MVFGIGNKKTTTKTTKDPYTTTTTTTKTTNGESSTKFKFRRRFFLLSIILLIQIIILLILSATAGRHNIWPFNRIWFVKAKMNMDRQNAVLKVGNKFSDLVGDIMPASFPSLGIPIDHLLVSQNSMKLKVAKDADVLQDAGVPQNQWENVQDMWVPFNKDETCMVYPTKDSEGVDIATFRDNVLNYKLAGYKVKSFFTACKTMYHIDWILCLVAIILILIAQFKFRDNNVKMFIITYVAVLLLLFMILFFNTTIFICMCIGINGLQSFLNRITIGGVPDVVSNFLGNLGSTLQEQMFYAEAGSMKTFEMIVCILIFIVFLLVLFEVIYMFLSLPTKIPKKGTTTTTTTTVRKMKRNPNGQDYEIDIVNDREY